MAVDYALRAQGGRIGASDGGEEPTRSKSREQDQENFGVGNKVRGMADMDRTREIEKDQLLFVRRVGEDGRLYGRKGKSMNRGRTE